MMQWNATYVFSDCMHGWSLWLSSHVFPWYARHTRMSLVTLKQGVMLFIEFFSYIYIALELFRPYVASDSRPFWLRSYLLHYVSHLGESWYTTDDDHTVTVSMHWGLRANHSFSCLVSRAQVLSCVPFLKSTICIPVLYFYGWTTLCLLYAII